MSALPSLVFAPSRRQAALLRWLEGQDWVPLAVVVRHVHHYHGLTLLTAAGWAEPLEDAGLLEVRATVALGGAREVRLPGEPPLSTLSPAVTPWQRICDAVAESPSAVWSLTALAKVGHCKTPVARLCVTRAVREGLLEPAAGPWDNLGDAGAWRAADVRGRP